MKQLVSSALLVGMLALLSCDFNPTGPFEGFEGKDGATLTGHFQQSGVALAPVGVKAQSALPAASGSEGYSVGVIVGGEEIGRVEVVNDAFTLRGLPDTFSLQFYDASDNPVGTPMKFAGVKPNQEIDLVVALNDDGSVEIIEERRTGIDNGGQAIEIEGRAREIAVTSADGMTGSLRVQDYHVVTRSGETSIRKGNRSLTLNDLQSGDQVHVRGVFEGDDVFAYEIKLQEEEDDDNGNVPVCDVRDPAKSNHILVCHKGRTLSISPNAWPGHFGHGDKCGPCS